MDAVGYVAASLTTLAFVPQVARTWRTRSARDVSWWWIGAFGFGLVLWLVYGVLGASLPLVAAQAATLALLITLSVGKIRADRPPTEDRD